MKLSEFVAGARGRLAAAGLECADPALHARQIAQEVLGLDAVRLQLQWDRALAPEELLRLEAFLLRRLGGEPFQYICGHEDFWDRRFSVGPGVLIPRKETEHLVEAFLAVVPREGRPRVAELGAGSGIVGIIALRERPHCEWYAFESSPAALAYARSNSRALLPAGAGYHLREADFFEAAGPGPWDWIVANPPYVPSEDWQGLSREVRHEPPSALLAGPHGLDVVKGLAAAGAEWLCPGGGLLVEIDPRQKYAVLELLASHGYQGNAVTPDLAGLPRVAFGRRPG